MHPSAIESSPSQETRQSKPALRTALLLRLASFGIVVALCLAASLFAALTHRLDSNAQALNSNIPANWQTYHDPRGLYSIRLPKEWTASRIGTGTTSVGYPTGSAPEFAESISFSDPALGEASASVLVNALAFQSDAQRAFYCKYFAEYGAKKPSHDISPQTLSRTGYLQFDSANAYFEVYVRIPGVTIDPLLIAPVPAPTPLPQQTVAADQITLAAILNSFQPAEPTPLSC